MIEKLLEKREGHGISDEDREAYLLGVKDALEALESDEVYPFVGQTTMLTIDIDLDDFGALLREILEAAS